MKRRMNEPPKDVMRLCVEIARGHERRKKSYENRRLDIIYHTSGGVGERSGTPANSNPVAKKAERLEKLENSLDAKFKQAVEQSLLMSGTDVAQGSRERLRKALLLNCESGHEYPYEVLGIDEFSRRDFYRRRKRFIAGIAAQLGLTQFED